jgi:hypothetical protein
MPLEPIRRRGAQEADRAEVESAVIAAVEANPEPFLAAYQAHPSSFGGRYVCADLFKETFPEYAASPEARGRFNGVVHNAAAVLSSEQFRRVVADTSEPDRDTAIFLTGIPGAGKTSFVLAGGDLDPATRVIFEGQLVNPATSIEKIGQAIEAGLKPVVLAVHPRPEDALANTFRRFTETGRGAGIGVMADIQGGLPEGLRAIERAFGDAVQLVVVDVRDRARPQQHTGWNSLPVLQTEGNREQVHQRLSDALEAHRAAGTITDDCYRQASGLPPRAQHASVDRPRAGGSEADARGRGDPRPGGGPSILMTPAAEPQFDGGERVVVLNGSRLHEKRFGGEWTVMPGGSQPQGMLAKGVYQLDGAKAADPASPTEYQGQIIHADSKRVFQLQGSGMIQHEAQRFTQAPAIGEVARISYQNGRAVLANRPSQAQPMKPADNGSYHGPIVKVEKGSVTQLADGKHVLHQLRYLTGSTAALTEGKTVAIDYRGGIGKVGDPQQQTKSRGR